MISQDLRLRVGTRSFRFCFTTQIQTLKTLNPYLASVDVIQNKVELVCGLEGVMKPY